MKERRIKFKELALDDDEFCGVYIELNQSKMIFVNANLYELRKNFTIAHELGHHFLGHTLTDGAIICDKTALDAKNKSRPEAEKEADHFAACILMPPNLMKQKKTEFDTNYNQQITLCAGNSKQAKTQELIDFLSNYVQVSKEAVGYRLEELKMI